MGARVAYAEAGAAMRQAVERALALDCGERKLRVLLVVLALTASYSKLSDRVYLAAIASRVFGIAEPYGWQVKKVGRDLAWLADRGVIGRQPARVGRPRAGSGGASYTVTLPAQEREPSQSGKGAADGSLSAEKREPSQSRKGAVTVAKGSRPRDPYLEVEKVEEKETHTHSGGGPPAAAVKSSGRDPDAEPRRKSRSRGWDIERVVSKLRRRLSSADEEFAAKLAEDEGLWVDGTWLSDGFDALLVELGCADPDDDDRRLRANIPYRVRLELNAKCEAIDEWLDSGDVDDLPAALEPAFRKRSRARRKARESVGRNSAMGEPAPTSEPAPEPEPTPAPVVNGAGRPSAADVARKFQMRAPSTTGGKP
ncbi:hypothetical protein ABN034_09350 [Actinopolymorpha sp. B11F2]|uniref:hypothetical protein n=1 Tax=Actinopolymorpha sp. B11F2 TaxID=3160862 RepID=UPI0032E368EF